MSEAIPSVYEQVKNKSDTFFIDEQLGPHYTTANLEETGGLNVVYPNSPLLMPRNSSNRDLLNMIDSKYHQVAQENPQYLGTLQTVHTQSQQSLHHRPGSITITTTAGGAVKHQ